MPKMGKDRNGSLPENSGSSEDEETEIPSKRKSKSRSDDRYGDDSGSDSLSEGAKKKVRKSDKGKGRKSRKRYSSSEDEDSYSDSESDSEYSDSEESGSESQSRSEDEEERRRRKRKRREREERERKRRRKEKERKRRRKEKDREEERKRRKRKEKKKRKEEKLKRGKTGAVTDSWGKYGVLRETDMWNKRPEFTAWLSEVKKVNLESLPNWEEKQMFKQFMEDHNTATFPSKKYYNLDAYHNRKMEKEMKRGFTKVIASERTVFNDEEQRRLELMKEREKRKEQEVETLKRAMQSGMAQDMKEQARLKEEMAYQYKIGNLEAAAAIQRRLDPDVAM